MRVAPASGGRGEPGAGGSHHRHELIDVAAAAEENAESLIEQDRMLVPLHEHRVQRPVKILTGADAGSLNGFERIEHRARPDRNARRAQRAGEVEDVFGNRPVALRIALPWPDHSAARKSDFISSSSSLTLLPSSRAMSS